MAESPETEIEKEFQDALRQKKNRQNQGQRKDAQKRVQQQANCHYPVQDAHQYLPQKPVNTPRLECKKQVSKSCDQNKTTNEKRNSKGERQRENNGQKP